MGGAAPVTFTCDVEDHRPGPDAELRFPRVTRQISAWLVERGWRGTFFVVGEEAERHPELVRELSEAGHEVGLHGWRHVPLGELGRDAVAADARRGRELLEQIVGTPVTGFRAPQFSLTRDTPWAHEVLADAGFVYSSSVLPNASPLFGYPGAPRRPFRWPSGLVELPAPVIGWRDTRVPVGGLYLRVLPIALTRRLLAGDGVGPVPWLYFHPYDFDPGERFHVIHDANPLASPLQWLNRGKARSRVEAVLGTHPGPPLGERLGQLDDLPAFG
jgi:polysaccharide deacetylase family protein (PEP-CTERM system associated)